VRLDVTDSESIAAAAGQIERDFEGRLDVLVNNAGICLGQKYSQPVRPKSVQSHLRNQRIWRVHRYSSHAAALLWHTRREGADVGRHRFGP